MRKKDVIRSGQSFLDLGTGSGILGIGLCKLGLAGTGLDIDPQAIVCATENVTANDVAEGFHLAVGSIDCLDKDALYDLVVANILSGPLIEMAGADHRPRQTGRQPDPVRHPVRQTGRRRGRSVRTALGLGVPERFVEGEWACLVWESVGER